MKIEDVPFTKTVWRDVAPMEHPGETGSASWRMVEAGNLRVRMVEYSPGFLQDHWGATGPCHPRSGGRTGGRAASWEDVHLQARGERPGRRRREHAPIVVGAGRAGVCRGLACCRKP